MSKLNTLRTLFLLVSCSFATSLFAQHSGVVRFERRYYWINISSKFEFISQADKDRDILVWGKDQGTYAEKYELVFSPQQTVYQEEEQITNYGYSWKDDNYLLIRNYENKSTKDLITFMDRNYIVEGEIPKYKWKILNEIKEIAGYLCMKAVTMDTVKNIPVYAWFTDKIPYMYGPEGYGGLPGMILGLELNGDDVLIEATNVTFTEDIAFRIPNKMKGKKINTPTFNSMVQKQIREFLEGKRNPYWSIRY